MLFSGSVTVLFTTMSDVSLRMHGSFACSGTENGIKVFHELKLDRVKFRWTAFNADRRHDHRNVGHLGGHHTERHKTTSAEPTTTHAAVINKNKQMLLTKTSEKQNK